VAARAPIVDDEENRYYISLEGDLYLYVVPPEPQYRFLLCPSIVPRIRRTTHNTSGRPLPGEEAMSLSPASRLLPRVRGPVSTTRLLPGVAPSFLGLVLFRLSLICLPVFGCCVAVLDCCACCRFSLVSFPRPSNMVSDRSPEAAPEKRVVEAIESADTLAALEGALHSLAQSECTIIVRCYGIVGRQPKSSRTSPTDVAQELGLSCERVRQLQRRAEDSLRAEMTANSRPAASE
jgi:Sigma-70, region 4